MSGGGSQMLSTGNFRDCNAINSSTGTAVPYAEGIGGRSERAYKYQTKFQGNPQGDVEYNGW